MAEKNEILETGDQRSSSAALENEGRRNAVKKIVGGTAAIAAYYILPSKWGTPVIEQVFLPAHAATSGSTITNLQLQIVNGDTTTDSVDVRITGSVVPATSGTTVNLTLTPST